MGRDIYVYAIPVNASHSDPNTHVCMHWDCVPCSHYDDSKEDVIKAVREFSEKHENDTIIKELLTLLQEYDDECEKRVDYFKKMDVIEKIACHLIKLGLICPLCHWYSCFELNPLSWDMFPPALAEEWNINHSYSNPIWSSKWCFQNFLYKCKMDMRYPSENGMFYKVTPEALESMKQSLQDLKSEHGDPLRTPDREALKETNDTIRWMDNAIKKGLTCIIKNEF